MKNWIAVASAEHVRRGLAGGFMQVCHGKAAPLRRMRPGDRVVYYSPTEVFRGNDKLRSFTAIGMLEENAPYQVDMGEGFCPYRRDVAWANSRIAPIEPLLGRLQFTADRRNWGYQLRFGLIEIAESDMREIALAMEADLFKPEQAKQAAHKARQDPARQGDFWLSRHAPACPG